MISTNYHYFILSHLVQQVLYEREYFFWCNLNTRRKELSLEGFYKAEQGEGAQHIKERMPKRVELIVAIVIVQADHYLHQLGNHNDSAHSYHQCRTAHCLFGLESSECIAHPKLYPKHQIAVSLWSCLLCFVRVTTNLTLVSFSFLLTLKNTIFVFIDNNLVYDN